MTELTDQAAIDQTNADGSKFLIFRYENAPLSVDTDMGSGEATGEHLVKYRELLQSGYSAGNTLRLLYRQATEPAFSLLHLHLKPHRILPRHSHGEDCLYVVTAGYIVMGTRKLYAGDGFFVPANCQYGYRVGDIDAELIEIRYGKRTFSLDIPEQPEAIWREMAATFAERRDEWQVDTVPSSRSGIAVTS